MEPNAWYPEVSILCASALWQPKAGHGKQLSVSSTCMLDEQLLLQPKKCYKMLLICQSSAFLLGLQDGFLVQTSSGQKFEDVDLSEGEWTEYDEKLGDSVEIMELQWRFAVHKP